MLKAKEKELYFQVLELKMKENDLEAKIVNLKTGNNLNQ